MNYLLLVLLAPCNLLAQNYVWARGSGSNMGNSVNCITLDQNNNVYVGLNSSGGTYYFGTDTFVPNGISDFILAKYSGSGNEVWQKQFGGFNSSISTVKMEGISDVIFDGISNTLLITGNYIETCNLGCQDLTPVTSNDQQIFLARLDLNGNCIWSKQLGSLGDDYGNSITLDNNNDIYMTGSVSDTGTFDTLTVVPGSFIAKFNSAGACIWSKTITPCIPLSTVMPYATYGIKYSNDYIYVLGVNNEDSLIVDAFTINSADYYGKLLAKFDLSGQVQWVSQFAGPNGSYPAGLRMGIDSTDNIYITGGFAGPVGVFGNDSITNPNADKDMYLCKIASNGVMQWVKQTYASNSCVGASLYTDPDGSCYVTGGFSGSAVFGTIGTNASTNLDIFLARFTSAGNCFGVTNLGEGGGTAVVSDNSSDCYLAGFFYNTINFGIGQLVSNGSSDVFVARHDAIADIGEFHRSRNHQLIIYANPNKGAFRIKLPDEIVSLKAAIVIVTNSDGKEKFRFELTDETDLSFDIGTTSAGTYSVNLIQGENSYSGKLIVE